MGEESVPPPPLSIIVLRDKVVLKNIFFLGGEVISTREDFSWKGGVLSQIKQFKTFPGLMRSYPELDL